MVTVLRDHAGTLFLGVLVSLTAFQIFYLMTVFSLSWGTSALHYTREKFLVMQLFAILFLRGVHADLGAARRARTPQDADVGQRRDLSVRPGDGAVVRGRHDRSRRDDGARNVAGRSRLRTAGHRPLRAVPHQCALLRQLADVQPRRHLRRLAGAPTRATYLAKTYSLQYVGYYLCAGAVLSMIGLLATRETKDDVL